MSEEEENSIDPTPELIEYYNILKTKTIIKKGEIPRFGRYRTNLSPEGQSELSSIIKENLLSTIEKRFPTEIDFQQTIERISKGRAGLIPYCKKVFENIKREKKGLYDILFSDINIKYYVIDRRYIDITKFTIFCIYLIKLQTEYVLLLKASTSGDGYLTSDDFTDYLNERLMQFPAVLDEYGSESSELPFYSAFLTDKLYGVLDVLCRNKLSATDIVCNPMFSAFIEIGTNDENPLSISTFKSEYQQYRQYVNDQGMIPLSDFKTCTDHSLSDAFANRIFELIPTYDGCIDYQGYTHFLNFIDNVDEEQSLAFFFRVFDIDGDGVIGPSDVLFFFEGVRREVKKCDVSFDVFLQEILDNVGAHAAHITIDEFIHCGTADALIDILGDIKEFETYITPSVSLIK